jgi:hypothetical protein
MKPLAMTSGTLYHLIRETHIGILAYYDLVLIRDDYFVTIRLIPFLQHVENRDMMGEGTQFRYKSLTLGEYQFGLRFRGNDQEYQELVDLYNRDTAAELPDTGLNKNLVNDGVTAAEQYDADHRGEPVSQKPDFSFLTEPPPDDPKDWLRNQPPLPKYEPGFLVWFMQDNRVYSMAVDHVLVESTYRADSTTHCIDYQLGPDGECILLSEALLFPTKQDLLASL